MSGAHAVRSAPSDPAAEAARRPTVFALHGLGLTGRAFDEVAALLQPDFRLVAIDLPGFGSAASAGAAGVDEMADAVLARIASETVGPWLVLGHSMGGKVASVVTSRVLDGSARVFGLRGVVLLAPSPVTPEPMADDKREEMLAWLTGPRLDPEHAREFVDDNVGSPWTAAQREEAVELVLDGSTEAWESWLLRGSREDWADAVGALDVPALVLAGDEDGDLGADAQPDLVAPTYPRATVQTLAGAGHLLLLERPAEVADAVRSFWADDASRAPLVPEHLARVIASDHTGARVRGAFAGRAVADDRTAPPRALTEAQLDTLRSVLARVLPVDLGGLDLAARLDARLAEGAGDGWRHGDLPDDATAYRLGLDELAAFDGSPEERDALLTRIQEGSYTPRSNGLTARKLSLWFTDLCADAATTWLQHPAALAEIGFDGFATGGDGPRKQGFTRLTLGTREGWEGSPGGPSVVHESQMISREERSWT
ncbi:alpha/beta hydrolase [Cnuibacter physcomitrellae]|uniref:alpha/beta hydrolase n=1 Tax=Cnuibacter physcomitrellae TaxID=1619308 RepID=UPI002175F114|nr:alpha/beta hydrolase [Cnuibacter physcomitrellae]MCS5497151.1 alpha/beta hydrolase [Cnuibacter physcomitrellae]